jgi:glycosyltransferase involved in cell wall biosynthesis
VTRLRYGGAGLLGPGGAPTQLRRAPLRMGVRGLAATAQLAAAVRHHRRPDERVVAHWLLPCGRLAPPGAVGFAHGSDVALLERLPRALSRAIDGRAGALCFVSDELRARFDARLGRDPRCPHHVLPMGVSPAAPDPAEVARFRALAAGRPLIATVGRLAPEKGLDVLAEALRGTPVCWLAAGDGPARPIVARHGICLGVLGPGARDALLEAADLFVQPSRPVGGHAEGCPVSVLEALRSGTPVVASRVGGIPATAGPAGARLVPAGDAEALRVAVLELMGDPARRRAMVQHHRAAAQRYLWAHLGDAHARVILRCARA